MPTIRHGRQADLELLQRLQQQVLAEPWPALLETAVQGLPPLFVIESDELLGYVVCISGDDEVAYVPELVVRSDRQGEGHGSRLLDFLIDRLTEQGFSELRLTVRVVDDSARAFYDAHGFEEIERLDDQFEQCDGLLLARDLS